MLIVSFLLLFQTKRLVYILKLQDVCQYVSKRFDCSWNVFLLVQGRFNAIYGKVWPRKSFPLFLINNFHISKEQTMNIG